MNRREPPTRDGEIRFRREEDCLAWARENLSPEQLAEVEKVLNNWRKRHDGPPRDRDKRVWIVRKTDDGGIARTVSHWPWDWPADKPADKP